MKKRRVASLTTITKTTTMKITTPKAAIRKIMTIIKTKKGIAAMRKIIPMETAIINTTIAPKTLKKRRPQITKKADTIIKTLTPTIMGTITTTRNTTIKAKIMMITLTMKTTGMKKMLRI